MTTYAYRCPKCKRTAELEGSPSNMPETPRCSHGARCPGKDLMVRDYAGIAIGAVSGGGGSPSRPPVKRDVG